MFGAFEQLANRRLLNGLARVHHHHPVGDPGNDTQIVTHVEDAGVDSLFEVHHQVQDGRLGGDVQAGGGLVHNEQIWLACQGHGNDHTLLHPPLS